MSIRIENVDTYGWEAAIRGMRNPKNSWNMSDSVFRDECHVPEVDCSCSGCEYFAGFNRPCLPHIGAKDLNLMHTLAKAGTDHGKFLRMITVTMDITAPLYWWKEYDTYKVGTVANSCSTMHKITDREFTLEDFSHEHLEDRTTGSLEKVVEDLNYYRDKYIKAQENYADAFSLKQYWWQMIQLLPSSYNQRRTVQFNYAVALNIYNARKTHKLDEWHSLCDEIKKLPYFEKICLED